MGDMIEDFKALKAINKERREKNYQDAQALKHHFTCHTQWHWSAILEGGKRIDYWPSSSRWRFDNKHYWGSPGHLVNFIKKRNNNKLPGEA